MHGKEFDVSGQIYQYEYIQQKLYPQGVNPCLHYGMKCWLGEVTGIWTLARNEGKSPNIIQRNNKKKFDFQRDKDVTMCPISLSWCPCSLPENQDTDLGIRV